MNAVCGHCGFVLLGAALADRLQKRIAVAYLINSMGIEPGEAARLTGFKRTRQAEMWAERLISDGHVQDHGAARGPDRLWTPDHVRLLADALTADPLGTGVLRIAHRLCGEGQIPKLSKATWLGALRGEGYSVQPSVSKLRGDPGKRLSFCVKVRQLSLSSNGAFSDSKIFAGGGDYKQGRVLMCWAPNGEPRERERAKPSYKVSERRRCRCAFVVGSRVCHPAIGSLNACDEVCRCTPLQQSPRTARRTSSSRPAPPS